MSELYDKGMRLLVNSFFTLEDGNSEDVYQATCLLLQGAAVTRFIESMKVSGGWFYVRPDLMTHLQANGVEFYDYLHATK